MKLASTILLLCCYSVLCLGQAKYVGLSSCAPCHKGEKGSLVYEKFLKTKHASAYKTLEMQASLDIAKKKGMKSAPKEAPECLECHITGYGVDASLLDAKYNKADGVTCEACHGAGGRYKAIHSKKDAKIEEAKAAGMIIPKDDSKLCAKCHNKKSPTFKSFDYPKAKAAIEHKLVKK
jgi:hypothetical protein